MNSQVVEWAARECTWQRSGEMSVLWMLNGWEAVQSESWGNLTTERIQELAQIVEPRHNDGQSFRNVNVRVGNDPKMAWDSVPLAMQYLISPENQAEPDEWFRQYEEIHPFRDGNGRTGSILWNWLSGSLDKPQEPPDFWNYRTPELFERLVNR